MIDQNSGILAALISYKTATKHIYDPHYPLIDKLHCIPLSKSRHGASVFLHRLIIRSTCIAAAKLFLLTNPREA
jgi:hypothetical protein